MSGNIDEIDQILLNAKENCTIQWAGNAINYYPPTNYCDYIFDGLMCWPPTPSGKLAQQSCSNSYIKSTKPGIATRQCYDNGKWGTDKIIPWTNYGECGDFFIEKITPIKSTSKSLSFLIPILKNITHLGYAISILSIIISLFIFIYIKRLHCSRNNLHINLFFSFILKALMSLIKDVFFFNGTLIDHSVVYVKGEPALLDNGLWMCKTFISLWHYLILTNYMFLLMEGSYLHNLMFLNLFYEKGVIIYCILGWGLPLIFIIPWVILKILYDDNICWTNRDINYINWFLDIPIAITIVINFLLFIIIIRVLFVKLTSMYIQQRRIKYRKLLKSTLILVPLFGIPYTISLILSFYIDKNETLELLWLFFDQSFSAFQGLFASLLYCLLNSEVQTELKRKYNSFKDRNNKEFKRNRTISHTQQSLLTNGDELCEIPPGLLKNEEITRKTSEYF